VQAGAGSSPTVSPSSIEESINKASPTLALEIADPIS